MAEVPFNGCECAILDFNVFFFNEVVIFGWDTIDGKIYSL